LHPPTAFFADYAAKKFTVSACDGFYMIVQINKTTVTGNRPVIFAGLAGIFQLSEFLPGVFQVGVI